MKYKIKAHPTSYAGVRFRSRLEARWAAFFNCMKWEWKYEPVDLVGWTPDFRVGLKGIMVLVEVKPYFNTELFKTHPCMQVYCVDTAGFGIDPTVTIFGNLVAGGLSLAQIFDVREMETAWIAAGNLTQWKKRKGKK